MSGYFLKSKWFSLEIGEKEQSKQNKKLESHNEKKEREGGKKEAKISGNINVQTALDIHI